MPLFDSGDKSDQVKASATDVFLALVDIYAISPAKRESASVCDFERSF